ncbi:hypothetical protein [Micromonospora auratinigra]|uniref:Uncharacterized protein n=1 Tax=Micromonospora auratinigra TaxID=261654 RepID=A0A1A9A6N5_9ACTN|nr:hypothetical protein [Micromonospora auratinigra]SBT51854.1 hypothetical protein GA0070611_5375 [Micromonospora auratinigra]
MIPEENQPAGWLHGYGGIEADIQRMREFADRLHEEVARNYAPHLSYIADDMKAAVPRPADAFVELVQFLQAHHETQQATAEVVWGMVPATGHLAEAAGHIAAKYRHTDAFAAARVADVESALAGTTTTPPRPLPRLSDPRTPEGGRLAPGDGPAVLP